jgi:hypothetical protein
MFQGRNAQRLVALFVAGCLLFGFPLLGLWNHDLLIGGMPLFPLALFVLWAWLIVALAWLMEGGRGGPDAPPPRAHRSP